LISFPTSYSIAQVVGIIKGKEGRRIIGEYPKIKERQ
jgi:hypothetical protein